MGESLSMGLKSGIMPQKARKEPLFLAIRETPPTRKKQLRPSSDFVAFSTCPQSLKPRFKSGVKHRARTKRGLCPRLKANKQTARLRVIRAQAFVFANRNMAFRKTLFDKRFELLSGSKVLRVAQDRSSARKSTFHHVGKNLVERIFLAT